MNTILIQSLGYILFFLMTSWLITVYGGHYLNRVFEGKPTGLTPILRPVEAALLRLCGLRECPSLDWKAYARQFILFNFTMGLLGFAGLFLQGHLPLNVLHFAGLEPWLTFNTICSFLTNTNWQSYAGESTLSNLSQMLVVTSFMVVGAASGLAVAIAFLRGVTNRRLGHFYQDFMRGLLYVFLPVMVVGSLFFISQGVPQTLTQQVTVHTMEGKSQSIAMGPVASLLTIKQFGTNGGGFFNANSAHPFENPNALTNWVEILMELAIPMAMVYLFGLWLPAAQGGRRQGWLIWGAMMILFLGFFSVGASFEQAGNPLLRTMTALPVDSLHGNLEGKELRFGIIPTMLFTTATTGTSTGAVNAMHDSLTPIGGLVPMADMMLNVIFGGVGVGLMGFLLYGIIAVFLTGLMVGRTPEIFGKKIEKPEIVLASIAILLHPFIIMIPTAIAAVAPFGLSSLNNVGPHGFSEILYAYTSAAANNGSAFAGLNANTPWFNGSIGVVILLGRYVSMIALLAISASLLNKTKLEQGAGTLRTNTLLFTAVWVGIILVIGALTFVPVLVLGPLADQMAMLGGRLY